LGYIAKIKRKSLWRETMRTTLTITLLSLLLLAGCRQNEQMAPVENGQAADAAISINSFALDMYRELASDKGNVFFSPASISTALAMTWAGAKGTTAEETARVLHLGPDRNRVLADYHQLLKKLNAPDSTHTLAVANRIWGQEDFPFRPQFTANIQHFFGGGFQSVDFRNAAEKERTMINQWVADHTSGKIQDLLPQGSIDKDTRLVLTNAVYFLGNWVFPFPEDRTSEEDFHKATGASVKTPTMKLTKNLAYYSNDSLAMVALPYKGRNLDFLIILPHEKDGLPELETALTATDLDTKIKDMKSQRVDVWLPRLEFSQSFSLNQKLQQLGMKQAFENGRADFSGMTDKAGLFITSVVHKSFLKVDEHGTEAAAATGISIGVTSMPAPPIKFVADHPFLFLIRHKETGTILFLGRLENPEF
jgi:serine protease inhibitor